MRLELAVVLGELMPDQDGPLTAFAKWLTGGSSAPPAQPAQLASAMPLTTVAVATHRPEALDALVQQQVAGVEREQPQAPIVPNVAPMGWLDRFKYPTSDAVTYGGTIYYNPQVLDGRTGSYVSDMAAHELQHVQQQAGRSWWQNFKDSLTGTGAYPVLGTDPATWSPDEVDAFHAEIDRRARLGRREYLDPALVAAIQKQYQAGHR